MVRQFIKLLERAAQGEDIREEAQRAVLRVEIRPIIDPRTDCDCDWEALIDGKWVPGSLWDLNTDTRIECAEIGDTPPQRRDYRIRIGETDLSLDPVFRFMSGEGRTYLALQDFSYNWD